MKDRKSSIRKSKKNKVKIVVGAIGTGITIVGGFAVVVSKMKPKYATLKINEI